MKKSELKKIIKETINEIAWKDNSIQESKNPHSNKKNKLKVQLKDLIIEANKLDSEYLQDIIKQYSDDIKNDDKEYAKILNWLRDRLNQQYPGNQNVSKTDLVKLLKEPAIKRDVKKLNNIKITDIVNDLFTM